MLLLGLITSEWYVLRYGDVRKYRISSAEHLFHYLKTRIGSAAQKVKVLLGVDSVIPLPTANAIAVLTDSTLLPGLLRETGAIGYRKAGYVQLVPPTPATPTSTGSWALDKIMADSAWAAGYDGSGVIVVVMDTGLDTSHPYLISKWSGLWYDPVEHNPRPVESEFPHGTIVSGVIVADSTGVAPGAKVAVVRLFGKYLTSSEITTHLGFERILEWKVDSGYNIRVYNGSWKTGGPDGSLEYWNDVYLLRLADIVPVFAIGNTSGVNFSPGNYPTVIGVGATYESDTIAHFSSEGPAPNRPPWNDTAYWPYPTWNLLKPDVVAPGVGVLTTMPGGGFQAWSGTSLASPLVAGAVAVLLQRDPTLTFEEVYSAITSGADTFPWGSPYPNNTYGWGRLNVWHSLNLLSPPSLLPEVVSWRVLDGTFDGTDTLEVVIYNHSPTSGAASFLLSTPLPGVSITDPVRTATLPASDTLTLLWEITASGLTDGTYVPFNLKVEVGDTLRYKLLLRYGTPPEEYVDVDTAALKVSFTRGGKWFRLLYGGVSLLYLGSFAFATDSSYVVDAWINPRGSDSDFLPSGAFSPLPFVPQGWYVMQTDSGHPSPKGLRFRTQAYAYPGDATLHLAFTVFNTTPSPITGYLAFFSDPDVGWASQDTGRVIPSQRCALIWAADSSFSGYIGFQTPQTPAHLSFIRNSGWYDTLYDPVKYAFISGSLSFAADTVSDWSLVLSVGPYTLTPGDSASMYLRVFYSDTPACPVVVEAEGTEGTSSRVVSVGRGEVVVKGGPVRLYDPSGRLVGVLSAGRHRLKRGVYFAVYRGKAIKLLVP